MHTLFFPSFVSPLLETQTDAVIGEQPTARTPRRSCRPRVRPPRLPAVAAAGAVGVGDAGEGVAGGRCLRRRRRGSTG